MDTRYTSFKAFYPYYLSEHSNAACRRLHFLGTSLGIIYWVTAFAAHLYLLIVLGFIAGYSCAWIGHFFFEKNKPATFTYPIYSFMGDWVMYKDIWLGRVRL
jgi:hypothetical protein